MQLRYFFFISSTSILLKLECFHFFGFFAKPRQLNYIDIDAQSGFLYLYKYDMLFPFKTIEFGPHSTLVDFLYNCI